MLDLGIYHAKPPGILIREEVTYSVVKQAKKAGAKIKEIIAQAKADKVIPINLFYRSLLSKGFHGVLLIELFSLL